jgi:phage tail sheath protein FI
MPVQVSYPGVYIREVPSGVRTITGVATSITLFIGMTTRGVLNRPTPLLSFADYQRTFGTDTVISEVTDQVRQFFQNGGKRAYVMRVANGAVAAEVALRDELSDQEVLSITAKDAGVDGNAIRLEVDYDTPAPESTFNLRVFRQVPDGRGGFNEQDEEIFRELSMDPDSGKFAVNVITQRSALINAARGADFDDAAVEPFAGYALSGRLFTNDADLKSAIDNAIDGTGPNGASGTVGRFRVSVDGSPFVEVSITKADINAGSAAADLASAINNALLAAGVSVNASLVAGPGALQYLQISSTTAGGSVVFRPAPSEDITAALELGLDRGGLEVGGHARRRPAPSGLFFRLGALGAAVPVPILSSLANQDRQAIEEYTLVDSAGSHNFTVSLGTPGGPLFEQGGENSLRHLRARLEIFANAINSNAAGNSDFNWSAAVHGHRLVLAPDFGNANNTATSFATTGSVAPYNLGAAGNGMDQPNTRYYSLNASGASSYQTAPGVDGFNGTIPTTQDYTNAFTVVDSAVDLFNLMILSRANGQTDAQREQVWGPASAFCQQRRAFLLIDPRERWDNVNLVQQEIADLRIGLIKDHAAVYWPRVTIRDPVTGIARQIDPGGSLAGVMARIDANRGVWKAPAGIEADIRGIRSVEHMMSDPENGIINPEAVNAIRVFPNGIVSWGARTVDGFDNSGNLDYKYVPVRRLALFIEESLFRGLKFAVFEPNDEPLWAQIRLAAGAFMNNLFRQGAFQGQKASDAYFVKVDSETTTQNDINLGIVNVVVGFAPLKPAEFVVITIQQKAGQVQT